MSQSVKLRFFESSRHACGYLDNQEAVNVFADPRASLTNTLYSRLIEYGFRRSGPYIYRPQCPACRACIPTRIAVGDFKPNRSQRRNLRANHDLDVKLSGPEYRTEHFLLYRHYVKARHGGGEMDNPTPSSYSEFLTCQWAESLFIEYRHGRTLVCVAVVDRLPQGLSSVYTFFDPLLASRGLGTYALLWQINEARRLAMDYVYPGYWIADNPKMAYKTRFQPIEGLVDGRWRRLTPDPSP